MKLSKKVSARKQTIYFNWCKKDFMEMTPRSRKIRAKARNPIDKCFWCKYKIKDGDSMALAQPTKGTNKILCSTCADELLRSKEEYDSNSRRI